MLTADLVRARARGQVLILSVLKGAQRERALELAAQLLTITDASMGGAREDWESGVRSLECAASERLLRDGLSKLVEDSIEFEQAPEMEPLSLRRELFALANIARAKLAPGEHFERDQVVRAVADRLGVANADVERGMFADLRAAQRLLRRQPFDAGRLVERYESAQIQGVLLRAVSIRTVVRCSDQLQYRRLFAALKFRRLLYRLERLERGYALQIDGPYSLFEAVTKYGLQLALAWTAFRDCDEVDLEAEVRWGKARKPLTFNFEHRLKRRPLIQSTASAPGALLGELEEIRDAVNRRENAWDARFADVLLDVPGEGICVPDLTFTHRASGWEAHMELMGFWSRDAVWRRVEWAQSGLGAPVLFVLSQRLRVSEEVLGEDDNASLYAYKGKPSVARILAKLDRLRVCRC